MVKADDSPSGSREANVLDPFGWDGAVASFAEPFLARGLDVGRVVSTARGFDRVQLVSGPCWADRSHVAFRQADLASPPAVGDWVAVQREAERAAIVDVAPRHGVLLRKGRGERAAAQVIAANVTSAACVFGLDRPVSPRRLERLLVLAHEGGLVPLVVLTKADIAKTLDVTVATIAEVAPGLVPLVVSVATGEGLAALAAQVGPGQTVALLGASGAGKSSLVNALAIAASQSVGDVRAGDQRGRHTTTARQLVVADAGGCLIDTPGLRAVGLWEADAGVADAFTDVEAVATSCRFRNCSHGGEPGCAVADATAAGRLDLARVNSYRLLQVELGEIETRATNRRRAVGEGRRPDLGAGAAAADADTDAEDGPAIPARTRHTAFVRSAKPRGGAGRRPGNRRS